MYMNFMMGNICDIDLKYTVFLLRCSLTLRCWIVLQMYQDKASLQLIVLYIFTCGALVKWSLSVPHPFMKGENHTYLQYKNKLFKMPLGK